MGTGAPGDTAGSTSSHLQPEWGPRAGTLSPLTSIRTPVAMAPEESLSLCPTAKGLDGQQGCTPGQGQDVPKSGTKAAGRGFINSILRSFGLFIYPAANSLCCLNPHLEIIQRNPPAQPSPRARAQTRCHVELQPQLIPSAATDYMETWILRASCPQDLHCPLPASIWNQVRSATFIPKKTPKPLLKARSFPAFVPPRAEDAVKPENSALLAAPCCDPDGTWQERYLCQGHAQTSSHAPAWPHSCSPPTGCTLLQWQVGDMRGPVPQQCHHCPFLHAASAWVPVAAPSREHGDPEPTQEEPRTLSPARAAPTSVLLSLHHASSWGSGLHMEQGRTGCSEQLLCQDRSGGLCQGRSPPGHRAWHWPCSAQGAKSGGAASVPKAFPV